MTQHINIKEPLTPEEIKRMLNKMNHSNNCTCHCGGDIYDSGPNGGYCIDCKAYHSASRNDTGSIDNEISYEVPY